MGHLADYQPAFSPEVGLQARHEQGFIHVYNALGAEIARVGPLGPEQPFLVVRWYGTALDQENIEVLDRLVYPVFRQLGKPGFLNDNRAATSAWDGINDWVDREFTPNLIAAGLRKLAMIESPDVFEQLSAQTFAENVEQHHPDAFDLRFFATEEEATHWLLG